MDSSPNGESVDDLPISSTAKMRDRRRQAQHKRLLMAGLALIGFVMILSNVSSLRLLITLAVLWLCLTVGLGALGALARPIPEPPPPGELRKVKLRYRCEECGTELRITLANDEVPSPPMHCGEGMAIQSEGEL